MENSKPKIMITFNEDGENGGPFISHTRIVESSLKEDYEFIPLIIPKGRRGLFNPKLQKQLIRQIKAAKPDIVQFTGLALDGFHTLLACRLAGIKNTLLVIHGSSREAVEFLGLKRKITLLLENWTLRKSAFCYGVSNYVANWDCVKKYAKNSFGYIYNFPMVQMATGAERASVRKQYGIGEEDVLIVSTGRITKEKGFADLADVILRFKDRPNVKFMVVGNGDYLETMQKRLQEQTDSGQVILTGYQKDVYKYLLAADIFTILTWHETLCNSVVEASGMGLPVVATRVGGIPEIVEDSHSGFLVENRNVDEAYKRLLQLVEDSAQRQTFGQHGRERIKSVFAVDGIVQQIDEVYKRILGK